MVNNDETRSMKGSSRNCMYVWLSHRLRRLCSDLPSCTDQSVLEFWNAMPQWPERFFSVVTRASAPYSALFCEPCGRNFPFYVGWAAVEESGQTCHPPQG